MHRIILAHCARIHNIHTCSSAHSTSKIPARRTHTHTHAALGYLRRDSCSDVTKPRTGAADESRKKVRAASWLREPRRGKDEARARAPVHLFTLIAHTPCLCILIYIYRSVSRPKSWPRHHTAARHRDDPEERLGAAKMRQLLYRCS